MDESAISQEINRELIEFENWSEINNSTDFEAFVAERGLDPPVAAALRDFLEMEKMIEGWVVGFCKLK